MILQPGDIIVDIHNRRYVVHSYIGDGYMVYLENDPDKTLFFCPEENT